MLMNCFSFYIKECTDDHHLWQVKIIVYLTYLILSNHARKAEFLLRFLKGEMDLKKATNDCLHTVHVLKMTITNLCLKDASKETLLSGVSVP